MLCLRGFTLKPRERAQVFLKSDTINFQISPPFDRSACFHLTTTGNFERFLHFNFETNFLRNENLFQTTGVRFFSLKYHPFRGQC